MHEPSVLTTIIFFGLPLLIAVLLARFVSGPWLRESLGWGISLLLSIVPLLAGFAVMFAFSARVAESTFFTILPFIVYFLVSSVLVKLFVKKGDEFGSGIVESLLLAFVQTVGTLLVTMLFLLVLLLITWALRGF